MNPVDDSPLRVSCNNLHFQINSFDISVTELKFVSINFIANLSQTKCILTFYPNVIIYSVINVGDNVCDQMLQLLNMWNSDCIIASVIIYYEQKEVQSHRNQNG